MWYLHSYVVCAKLFVYGLFTRPTPFMINIFSRQTLNIIPCFEWDFYYPMQNYKFYYTPQHSWGFIIKVNKNLRTFKSVS